MSAWAKAQMLAGAPDEDSHCRLEQASETDAGRESGYRLEQVLVPPLASKSALQQAASWASELDCRSDLPLGLRSVFQLD